MIVAANSTSQVQGESAAMKISTNSTRKPHPNCSNLKPQASGFRVRCSQLDSEVFSNHELELEVQWPGRSIQ
jgi:hypothetical protein